MRKKNITESIFLDGNSESAKLLQQGMRGVVIGQFIKLIRSHLGMSQRALADRSEVPQSMISKVESNKVEPTLSTLRRILDALSCDLVIAPVLRKSIDAIRRDQAKSITEQRMRYLRGTMSLEKQEPSKKFMKRLAEQKEDELLQDSGSKLWED